MQISCRMMKIEMCIRMIYHKLDSSPNFANLAEYVNIKRDKEKFRECPLILIVMMENLRCTKKEGILI